MTFRIDKSLKAALSKVAREEQRSVGELLRDLVRDRIDLRRRREFEAEARRQSHECALAAAHPESEEAAVMRELDGLFEDLIGEEGP